MSRMNTVGQPTLRLSPWRLKNTSLMRRVIEQELGLRVSYTAAVDFKGFERVIDLLGGVEGEIRVVAVGIGEAGQRLAVVRRRAARDQRQVAAAAHRVARRLDLVGQLQPLEVAALFAADGLSAVWERVLVLNSPLD